MKKNVIFVIIIVLLLGIIGFGGYKYMNLQKDNDKLSGENKAITEELNKQKEETEQAKTEQEKASATNDYSLFVKQLKTNRKSVSERIKTWGGEIIYLITLDSDGVLKAGDQVSKKEVAKDVLFFRSAYYGNGGYQSLYYVTEDGKAYKADVEYGIVNKETFKTQIVKGVSDVVNIIASNDVGTGSVAFVDINGNIQKGSID